MEDLRLSAVATRLVAWHNRHPLARRIKASQVHAIGYVALPFASSDVAPPGQDAAPASLPQGGTLRERARARARKQEAAPNPATAAAATASTAAGADGPPVVMQMAVDTKELIADFSEDFIDPLTPHQVARFALGHGHALARPPDDGPVRRVRADGAQPGQATVLLYLLTAVIETGTRKSRVLLGAGDAPMVLGRRVHSRPRLAALAVPMAAVGAAAALWLRPLPAPTAFATAPAAAASAAASAPAQQAAAVTPAASAVVLAAAASSAVAASAASAATAASAASAPAVLAAASAPPSSEPAASAPLDVEPHLGRIEMASIRPQLSPNQQAAKAAGVTLEAASAPRGPQAPAAAAPAKPAGPPAFALSTRPLRTRAEADQVKVAMKSLLRAMDVQEVRVDVLPEGDDWRVVGMPFANRGEADKARTLLVSRGMRVEVVGF